MGIIVRIILNMFALLVVVNIVPGTSITQWGTLIAVALVIAILNSIIKPVILILTLPINILTLGLFTLLINAFLMYLASVLVKGFYVQNFASAFWGALVFSIVSIFLNMFIGMESNSNRINK